MSWRDRLPLIARGRGGGAGRLHVGDPRFDDWAVVRDFEELGAARAWRQHIAERGIEAVLTADWPLDEFDARPSDRLPGVIDNAWMLLEHFAHVPVRFLDFEID